MKANDDQLSTEYLRNIRDRFNAMHAEIDRLHRVIENMPIPDEFSQEFTDAWEACVEAGDFERYEERNPDD